MKKTIIFLLVIFLNLPFFSVYPSYAKERNKNNFFIIKKEKKSDKKYLTDEILVKYKNNKINLQTFSGRMRALNFANSKFLERKENLKNNTQVLKIKDGKDIEEKILELKNNPDVEYAEPNYKRQIEAIDTDDTYRNYLWGLDNIGQTVNGTAGTIDKDIDALEAWAINEGTNATVTVAIIDTGVSYNHPDLFANMWDGSECLDENGDYLGDCNYGYDFEDDDKTPLPTTSNHGTHVAGTIAAVKNNGLGIIGVAPNTKIMALKFGLDTASEIRAIDFAIQNGAKVINASYGGDQFSQAEYDAIERFRDAGGIFVAAAGNDGKNNENSHSYPSDYDLDNIISVAATDQFDNLASFSNYGTTSVDVAAPGVNIYSTIPQASSTDALNENFESIEIAAISDNWETATSSNWGVRDMSGIWPAYNQSLVGDINTPYASSSNSVITLPTYDLSDVSSAKFDFWTACDTEYDENFWTDYMALEISLDGNSFERLTRWDEFLIDTDSSSSSYAFYHVENLYIPSNYLTANFKLRFRWVTNSSDNDHGGCAIDNFRIIKNYFDDGSSEQYSFKNGTSMATPHVVGLVALIEGYNANLSYSQVKSAILDNGDSVAFLSGKTVSGKRINAQNSLQAVDFSKTISSFYFSSLSATGTIDEDEHTISLTVPFGTDVATLTPTIVITGASVSPTSLESQDFSEPVEYVVTAADSSTKSYIVSVIVEEDPDLIVDRDALTEDLIKGENTDLSNIILPLASLPETGGNGSEIIWLSDKTVIVSSDGQTINRPFFADGNATATLTAILVKGEATSSKEFDLIVLKLPASSIATVTSVVYTLSDNGTSSKIITGIPYGTSKNDFLSNLSKGENNQVWDSSNVNDPVVTGNFLISTAQNGTTTVTYEITTLLASAPVVVSSGGGGGGGGGGSVSISVPIINQIIASTSEEYYQVISTTTVENIKEIEEVIINNYDSLYGLDSILVNVISEEEAGVINNQSDFVSFSGENVEIYKKIVSTYQQTINNEIKRKIAYFIEYGSPTTKKLGAGERAGSLNSYISAFGSTPDSSSDWQDVVKIANGRWPNQRSQEAEELAKDKFKKVYLREADMENPNDNAAVTVMAYGLRPVSRNMNSEKIAIIFFKSIYKKNPENAQEWDIVRAIAYSGAKR